MPSNECLTKHTQSESNPMNGRNEPNIMMMFLSLVSSLLSHMMETIGMPNRDNTLKRKKESEREREGVKKRHKIVI